MRVAVYYKWTYIRHVLFWHHAFTSAFFTTLNKRSASSCFCRPSRGPQGLQYFACEETNLESFRREFLFLCTSRLLRKWEKACGNVVSYVHFKYSYNVRSCASPIYLELKASGLRTESLLFANNLSGHHHCWAFFQQVWNFARERKETRSISLSSLNENPPTAKCWFEKSTICKGLDPKTHQSPCEWIEGAFDSAKNHKRQRRKH